MPSMEIQISTEAHVALKERAKREGINMRNIVRNIVEAAVCPLKPSTPTQVEK